LRKLITWSYQELGAVEIEWSRLDALQAGLSNLVEALLVVQGEVRALQERLPVLAHPDLGTSGGEKAESTEDALAPGGAIDSLIVGELERVISRLKGAPEGGPDLDPCG